MWFRVLAAGGENCKKGLVLGACKYSLLDGEPRCLHSAGGNRDGDRSRQVPSLGEFY